MKATLLSLICLLTTTLSIAQNITFNLASPHPAVDGAIYGDLELGDIDGDGDLDLFVTGRPDGGFSSASSSMYLNDGNGNFTADESVIIQALEGSAGVFSDLDMDGDLDLLVNGIPGNSGYYAGLYLNDGFGQFMLLDDTPFLGAENGDVAVGDVDGDGDKDIFFTGRGFLIPYISKLYINDGSAGFTEDMVSTFMGVAGQAEFADIDGDSDLDIISAGEGPSGNSTLVHLNDGSGVFTPVASDFSDLGDESFAIGDLDNDGDVDVLLTGRLGISTLVTELYLNDGAGNFTLVEEDIFPEMYRGQTSFTDFDADGDLDVFMSGTITAANGVNEIKTKVFENQGNNVFLQSDSLIGCNIASLAVGDINGDESPDFILSGINDGELEFPTWVYLNTTDISTELIEELNEDFIQVFPNPSNGMFTIRLPEQNQGFIQIYNTIGQLVYEAPITNSQHQLDLAVPDGIYSLIVRDTHSVVGRSISIAH